MKKTRVDSGHLSVKPAKIAQMEQKDLLFAQRPSEQTVSLRREFERRGNYAERIHFGPRIFNTREWDVQRKWDPKGRHLLLQMPSFLVETDQPNPNPESPRLPLV